MQKNGFNKNLQKKSVEETKLLWRFEMVWLYSIFLKIHYLCGL